MFFYVCECVSDSDTQKTIVVENITVNSNA